MFIYPGLSLYSGIEGQEAAVFEKNQDIAQNTTPFQKRQRDFTKHFRKHVISENIYKKTTAFQKALRFI